MMKIKRLGLLWVVMLVFTSCNTTAQETSETLPGINIPAERFNTAIKLLDAPELLNSHKNGELLTFQIINLSNVPVVFPENYGVKIFTKKDGAWIDVTNNSYNAGDTFYLPTRDSYPLGDLVDTMPFIVGLASPITVRVIIIGHKENDNEQVGAYVDVTINP
jgi:hypothetical protein